MFRITLILSVFFLFACSKINEKGETVTSYGFSVKDLKAEFGTPDSMRVLVIVDGKDTISNDLYSAADLDGTKLLFDIPAMQGADVRVVYWVYAKGAAVGAGDQTFSSGESPTVPKPSLPSMASAGANISALRGRITSFGGAVTARADEATQYAWDFDGDGTFDDESSLITGFSFTYDTIGVFSAVFRVTGALGLVDLDTLQVTVTNPPLVIQNFQAPSNAIIGVVVEMNVNARVDFGIITNYEWDLNGDGSWDSSGMELSYMEKTYRTMGKATVIVRVTDSDFNQVLDTAVIVVGTDFVNFPPEIDGLILSDTVVTIKDSVGFRVDFSDGNTRADIRKFEWDLNGDGVYEITKIHPSSTTSDSVTGYFSAVGSLTVKVRLTDSSGVVANQSAILKVLEGLPTATLNSDISAAFIGQAIGFTVTAADLNGNAKSGSIVKYLWDFNGDGVWDDSTGAGVNTASHVYAENFADSIYSAMVRVRDDDGKTADTSLPVHITNRAPVLGTILVGDSVIFPSDSTTISASFTDADGNGIDSLFWDLDGDGVHETPATRYAVQKLKFSSLGNKLITVFAKDRCGAIASGTVPILVKLNSDPAITSITQLPVSSIVTVNDEVTLSVPTAAYTDTDGNQIDSLWWDLDGSNTFATKRASNLSVIFSRATPGVTVVSVKGKDASGAWSTPATKTITVVNDPPVITLIESMVAKVGQYITLIPTLSPGTYGGSIVKEEWDEGGQGYQTILRSGSGTSVSFLMPSTQNLSYLIIVRITDEDGFVAVDSVKISVYNELTDARDGQIYPLAVIGTQVWMGANLNYSGDNGLGGRTYTKGWCYGVSDTAQHQDTLTCNNGYGRIYHWADGMALDRSYLAVLATISEPHQGLCPTGYHVPTNGDWTVLKEYIQTNQGVAPDQEGRFLKAYTGLTGTWVDVSSNSSTNPFGFSALPAGFRRDPVTSGGFEQRSQGATFLSATQYSERNANYAALGSINLISSENTSLRFMVSQTKDLGASLRCLKD